MYPRSGTVQQCFAENITRDLTGRSFPLQVVSFHLLRPQGRLRCRNKELLGFKADSHCFPQERARSLQVDSTDRAASEPRQALCSLAHVLGVQKQLSLSQQERSCLGERS